LNQKTNELSVFKELIYYVNRVNVLEELNIPVKSTSQDIAKNQYGNKSTPVRIFFFQNLTLVI
jgi:hypothetical protein